MPKPDPLPENSAFDRASWGLGVQGVGSGIRFRVLGFRVGCRVQGVGSRV